MLQMLLLIKDPNLNEKANLNEGPNREGNKQNPMGGGKGMGSSGGYKPCVWNGDDHSNYSSVLDSAVPKNYFLRSRKGYQYDKKSQ